MWLHNRSLGRYTCSRENPASEVTLLERDTTYCLTILCTISSLYLDNIICFQHEPIHILYGPQNPRAERCCLQVSVVAGEEKERKSSIPHLRQVQPHRTERIGLEF